MNIKEMALENSHISSGEIQNDIADTEAEIEKMEEEIVAFEMLGDKISMFKASNRRNGIEKRKAFIEKLRGILDYRKETSDDRP